jgi:hypothetical protein
MPYDNSRRADSLRRPTLIDMDWWMHQPPEVNVDGSWTSRPPAR